MKVSLLSVFVFTILAVALPQPVVAHCDTFDGPVVTDAKTALKKGEVTPVLKWVSAEGEPEVRAAFQRTLAARSASPEARDLADHYFFETLVRVHRQGEGAPYTGLKSGAPEAVIEAADAALEKGSVDALEKELLERVARGLRDRFATLQQAKEHADHNVEAGRRYVAAYVDFMHYAERVEQFGAASHAHAAATEHQH